MKFGVRHPGRIALETVLPQVLLPRFHGRDGDPLTHPTLIY